ncbi:acyltransferase [Sulfobacillus harzensis]|uniref:Acyltransferase n=1 Tax=Sulfobacillus harzensis TaxID=2729629 RepID=A0A7Y0L3W3_9FIRM|nr:acyltransferase [Sulfobacillus harzensis]NMP22462.1 acyltransferase [Sulfobacillus harzensis]
MGHADGKPTYVYSLDWVRALTIVAVVAVHAVRFGLVPSRPDTGSLVQVLFQFGRVSFMVVTGFIVAYQYRSRTPRWMLFFQRRAKSAVAPYLIWLAVFLSLSVPVWPAAGFWHQYSRVLFTGNGHLYYLIITFQMYLLAPVLIWGLGALKRRLAWLAAASVIWEAGSWTMAGYLHQSGWAPALLVITYVGYFVLGGTLGYAWEAVRAWLRPRRRWLAVWMIPLWAAVILMFFTNLHWIGGLGVATSEFQPMSAVYCLGVTMVLLATGTWFEEARVQRPQLAWIVGLVADASFGIYLVHPLFVHGWLNLASRMGWSVNPVLNTAIALVLGVGLSIVVVVTIRLLPFSEYVVGTKRRIRATKVAASSSVSDHMAAS